MQASPDQPRILGIVGGTGPESTVDYYRSLIATWRRRRDDGSYPRVIIDSVELGAFMRGLGEHDMPAVGRILGGALAELARAGCGRALLASNASHLAFDDIDPRSSIPLIHIVEVTRNAAAAVGHRRLGVVGTQFVMRSSLYADGLVPAGLTVVTPTPQEQERVHEIYVRELLEGIVLAESRAALVAVAMAMRERDGIDGLILAGTELALILTEREYGGIPMLNTAQIQVDAAVDWLLGDAGATA
jgi:aspartate racemase